MYVVVLPLASVWLVIWVPSSEYFAEVTIFPAEELLSEDSDYLNYATDTAIDQGWVRLSLPFTVSEKKTYKVCVYSHCVGGDVYVDDFQLECSDTPSTLNLLENGNLQYWGHGWTMGSNAKYQDDCGLFSESHYAYSIRTTGDAYTESCAYQDVPVGKAGASFVMSGWAKANAIPDNKQTETGDDAAAKDKHKQFGLRAILTYFLKSAISCSMRNRHRRHAQWPYIKAARGRRHNARRRHIFHIKKQKNSYS